MIDLTVTVSAWPWAEISQSLSHVIGGFPAVFLPMLIYGEFLESSYEPLALSHRSLDLPIAVISVFVECWEASGTARVYVSSSLEGLSLQPLPGTSFFFFLKKQQYACLFISGPYCHQMYLKSSFVSLTNSLSMFIHCHEGVIASLLDTR